MVAAGGDLDPLVRTGLARNPVYQPVVSRDPAGPPTGKVPFERLRFPKADKKPAPGVLDEEVHLRQHIRVGVGPMPVIVPAVFGKVDLHSSAAALEAAP